MQYSSPRLRAALVLLVVWCLLSAGCQSAKEKSTAPEGQPLLLAEAGQGSSPSSDRREFLDKRFARKAAKGPKRFDQPSQAQQFFASQRLPKGETSLPVQKYIEAINASKRMPVYSSRLDQSFTADSIRELDAKRTGALSTWTSVGPGNVGGRTRALIIQANSPNIMYAGGVAGGVWKTTNSGATWTPLGDLFANMAVCSLAQDQTNPQIVYAGTGEGYFNSDAVRGAGIFKTADGGATWSQLPSTATSDFYYVNRLVISPNDHTRIYAATRTGLWVSPDSGATWSKLYDASAVNGVTDLLVRTDTNPDTLVMSCGTFISAPATASIQRSEDAGETWTQVHTEPGMARTALAMAPSDQSILYALASSNAPGHYKDGMLAVLRSADGGETWTTQVRNTDATKLNTALLSNPYYVFYETCAQRPDAFFNQGWYDNVIAVDPTDPNRVWAGGIDLFRSDDQGQNWGLASCWWADPGAPFYVHADHHAIVFHPNYNGTTNTTMFVGNDGGIFKTTTPLAPTSTDPCASTGNLVWTNLNNGYGVTQFYYGAVYPGGSIFFAGAQDNGVTRGSLAGGANNWTTLIGGDGGAVAVNPQNTQILYAENDSLSFQKSVNGGAHFSNAHNGITAPKDTFPFITPFVMDPNAPDTLWIGGSSLWRTTDAAENWTPASTALANGVNVSALAVYKGDSNRVAYGTTAGQVLTTTAALSAGATTDWSSAQVVNGYISSVVYAPGLSATLYATCSTFGQPHVLKSTDSGATWTSISGSGAGALPDVPALTVMPDPNNRNRLYVGTDIGVYVTSNGGGSWAVEHTGFANVTTANLVIEPQSKRLYAFTHGRGAWYVPLPPAKPAAGNPGVDLLLMNQ
ncbi:WD40/YVTN/BNR-like repeat-containing protein [Fundidesulfovibrio soli]|uniref:WD40/YVTN/BNR-like repeat-containing protein n=1 Tax=Fundidesulfovibrio soli TaxID=2922716 RepID=UPI001FAE9BB9|nr:sialidase family protein [Fundidesulfovibrio soli]